MDISSERPRAVDFESHIGGDFAITPLDSEAGPQVWQLEKIEILPTPPIEGLADGDCFILEFAVPEACEQGFYEFKSSDGTLHTMVAIPVMGNSGKAAMHVVIN